MAAPLFFAGHISSNDIIPLDEENSRHIVQVLRMKSGETIWLTDGRGHRVKAAISEAHKKHCTARPLSSSFTPRREPPLTIGISLVKNAARFEWFLEKATELGTAAIIPLICDRTEKQRARRDRLESICRSAMLQSGQSWMPEVHEPAAFRDVVRQSAPQQKLFGHITAGARKLALALNPGAASHLVLIGPEGDFTDEESALALASGFEGVSFGETILRVETAGLFAATVHAALT